VSETEWDEQQQAWMLALDLWRAQRCPHCGRNLDECTSAQAEDAWVAPPPTRCHAATAVSIRQDQYRDTPQAETLLWSVHRR
jgi:hypothetical protein